MEEVKKVQDKVYLSNMQNLALVVVKIILKKRVFQKGIPIYAALIMDS